jgi:hypothetical protein
VAKTFALGILCIGAGFLVPLLAFSLLGVVVGNLWPVPHWMISHDALLRMLVWTVPVLLCAFAIARLARSNSLRFGLLGGASASVSLVVMAATSEYRHGESTAQLVNFLLPELSVSALVLPLATVLLARRAP